MEQKTLHRFSYAGAIERAYEKGEVLETEKGKGKDVNLSSIATTLIQVVGRFCERHADDFLLDWRCVEDLVRTQPQCGGTTKDIVVMGIRRCGVDHVPFLMANLRDNCWDEHSGHAYVDRVYRKIYAIGIIADPDGRVEVTLKDLTDSVWSLDARDLKWRAPKDLVS